MLFSDRVAGAAVFGMEPEPYFLAGSGSYKLSLYFKTCYFNGNIRYRNLYFDCILICYRLESK